MFALRRSGHHALSALDDISAIASFTVVAHSRRPLVPECGQCRRISDQLPFGLKHFFQYGSDAYVTQAMESCVHGEWQKSCL